MNPGLSQEAVLDRLKQFGYNELPSGNQKSIYHIIIEVVKEPMFILLLICGSLYLLLGEYSEGGDSIVLGSGDYIHYFLPTAKNGKGIRGLTTAFFS